MTRIDEIRDRLNKATPGPWEFFRDAGTDFGFGPVIENLVSATSEDGLDQPILDWGNGVGEADAQLIANAPADLAWLLGEVERLEGLLMDAGITYTGPSADAAFQAAQRVSPGRLDPEWFAAGKHQHGASPITQKEN